MSVDVLCDNRLAFPFVVGNDQFDGIEDRTYARSGLFQIFANRMLQQTLVDHSFHFGVTDLIHESADRLRGVTATTQTADGRHTRVIPTGYKTFFDQLQHLTLGHNRIGDVQTIELALFRTVVRTVGRESAEILSAELVNEIIVERTMHLELKRTDRVRYALKIVALSMGEIVHRIYFPFRTRTMVRVGGDDTIHDRVTEMHVGVRHVNLGAQHHLAFLYLTALHRFKQAQVLFDRTITERRSHTRFGRRSFLFGDLLGGLFVYISFALFDEHDRQVVELLEIIRGIEDLSPFESEPTNIAFDGLYILRVFFGRVGVVKTKVTNAVVFLGDSEVHTDRLDVTDMQVTVRLRRETGLNTSVIHALCEVFFYDLLNKIETFFLLFHI